MIIELRARVDEDGQLVFDVPISLPPGVVDVVITYHTAEEVEDEARWEAQFAATPATVFQALIDEGLREYRTGETSLFDPNQE